MQSVLLRLALLEQQFNKVFSIFYIFFSEFIKKTTYFLRKQIFQKVFLISLSVIKDKSQGIFKLKKCIILRKLMEYLVKTNDFKLISEYLRCDKKFINFDFYKYKRSQLLKVS